MYDHPPIDRKEEDWGFFVLVISAAIAIVFFAAGFAAYALYANR